MAEPAWEPLSIESKAVVSEDRGMLTIEWKLSTMPPPEWSSTFGDVGGGRTGTGAYTLGPGPQVRSGTVTWQIPEQDMADANRHVSARVEGTNGRYRQILADKATKAAKDQAVTMAAAQRRADAQAKLDELG